MENPRTPVLATAGDKVALWALTALIFLSPLFFISPVVAPFQFTKMMLLYAGTIVAVLGWMVGRLSDGRIPYPRHAVFTALGAGLAAYGIATLLSPVRAVSLFGQGMEVSTFAAFAVLTVLLFLSSQYFSNRKGAANALMAFVFSAVVLVTFEALRILIGPGFLSLGTFRALVDNPVGGWNDMGVFVGAAAIVSLVTLELLVVQRRIRGIFVYLLIVSLFILSVVNFQLIWYVLAGLALVFFVYNFSFRQARDTEEAPQAKRALPIVSLVVLIVAFVFILSKGNLYSFLGNDLGMGYFNRFSAGSVDVRPSWSGTMAIARQSVMKHPLFGVGPNRFESQWLMSKPEAVNLTDFWAVDFGYGVGLVPSLVVTAGLVGFLAYAAFLAILVYLAYRVLFARIADPFDRFITVAISAVAIYLWVFAVVYVPSATLATVLFVFTGALLGRAIAHGAIRTSEYAYAKAARSSFVVVLGLVFLMLGSVVFGYAAMQRYVSSVFFTRAVANAASNANIGTVEGYLLRAARTSGNDAYYRLLSDVELYRVNQLLSDQSLSADKVQAQLAGLVGNARAAAEASVAYDRTNYRNWLSLGKVFETLVPLAGDEAYKSALAAYTEARKTNPKNPSIPLMIARLELAHKDAAKAKENVAEAMRLKGNYVDAIFFLAQMQVGDNDLKGAIQSVSAAAQVSPNDPGIFFQLGLLYYNNKDYAGSASAFERAVQLVPDYANAKYFLGLSYDKLKRNDVAVAQFADLAKTNPDNQEIALILSNLQSGRDPFSGAQPPIDNKPEKRAQPPVKEKSAAAKTSVTGNE